VFQLQGFMTAFSEGFCGGYQSIFYDLSSQSWVLILGPKWFWFTDRVGLHQGCPSSPVLFLVFMDRIWRCSRGEEGVWFGNFRVTSLLSADDVVLLASSGHDLQFTAECEAAGMKVSSSRSEAVVLVHPGRG